MKPHLYLFRGAPASGKTTMAHEFGKSLGVPVALLIQDHWRYGIHSIGRGTYDIDESEHVLADDTLVVTLEQYLKSGNYIIIVEGAFTWDTNELSHINGKIMASLARKYSCPFTSVVLKANLNALVRRNTNQKRMTRVPNEAIRKIFEMVYSSVDPQECVVDSTGKSVKETLKLIQAELKKRRS